jgi:REP element-mobilizing transposase RayT
MWNDTDLPLGYLITFRCRGTWLHGDERGSTDRFQNIYKTPHIPANRVWNAYNSKQLKSESLILDAPQRRSVEKAIRETCSYRQWRLRAINVRTNHAHVVVSIGETKPERALNAFKANATRQMREDGNWERPFSPWADKGSQRYLWNERSLGLAVDYVVNGQGDELPEFD